MWRDTENVSTHGFFCAEREFRRIGFPRGSGRAKCIRKRLLKRELFPEGISIARFVTGTDDEVYVIKSIRVEREEVVRIEKINGRFFEKRSQGIGNQGERISGSESVNENEVAVRESTRQRFNVREEVGIVRGSQHRNRRRKRGKNEESEEKKREKFRFEKGSGGIFFGK